MLVASIPVGPTELKRYRVLTLDFDTRATILRQEISPSWQAAVRQTWEHNQNSVRNTLLHEFGSDTADAKLTNFLDIGPRPVLDTCLP